MKINLLLPVCYAGLFAVGLAGSCLAQGRQSAAPAVRTGPLRPAHAEMRSVPFTCVADSNVRSVTVAGTFNSWKRDAMPLVRRSDGRTWRGVVSLEPGLYQYKFVVNGRDWRLDPTAPKISDGNGNENSQLIVAPHGYDTRPGIVGDGLITGSAVQHLPTRRFVSRRDRTHLMLTLRTRHNDVRSCAVAIWEGNRRKANAPNAKRWIPMARISSDALFDYWQATVPLSQNSKEILRYAFRLQDGPNPRLYDAGDWLVAGSFTPKWFQLDPMDFPPFDAPEWAADAIFYQIFPDRFANGERSNDPPNVVSWDAKPTFSNWMGGDLAGVREHLNHLRELGVNAIYFNPLFAARSNHAYDTMDYHKVDPRFGTNAQLKQVVSMAHEMGWHIILDGVFNHTGVDAAPFRSLRNQAERSPYRDWYFVKGFPIEVKDGQKNYEGWFGSPWMPKLNVLNPATREYLLDVGTRWIRYAKIDGWRLDAADEVNSAFWQAFRKAVRQANPHTFLVGEIWGNAAQWLQGDQFDSVMNYRWRGATLDFFALDKLSVGQFDAALAQIRNDYPPNATNVMFNMLGSHDVERLRTVCKGDRPREQQCVLFQFTYPGIPNIYYGDEVGMEGGRDPDNRRGMEWDKTKQDGATFAFYQKLTRLRRDHAVLRRGDYKTVLADDTHNLFGFLRTYKNERVLAVFNRSATPQDVSLPASAIGNGNWHDLLDATQKTMYDGNNLRLTLPPHGFVLLGS